MHLPIASRSDLLAIQLRLHRDAAVRAWAAAAQATGAQTPRHIARALLVGAPGMAQTDDLFEAALRGTRAAMAEGAVPSYDLFEAALRGTRAAMAEGAVPSLTINLDLSGDRAALVCSDADDHWRLSLALADAPSQDWVIQLQGSRVHILPRTRAALMMALRWHDDAAELAQIHAAMRAADITLVEDPDPAEEGIQWEAAPILRHRSEDHTYLWRVGIDRRGHWWTQDQDREPFPGSEELPLHRAGAQATAPDAMLAGLACYGPYLTRLDARMVAEIAVDEFAAMGIATALPAEPT